MAPVVPGTWKARAERLLQPSILGVSWALTAGLRKKRTIESSKLVSTTQREGTLNEVLVRCFSG